MASFSWSHQPPGERERMLKTLKLKKYTDTTIVDPGALKQQLSAIRRQGYAFDDKETRPNLSGIAVPIFNADGCIAAAIAISAYQSAVNRNNSPDTIKYLMDKTFFISRQLGYHPEIKPEESYEKRSS